MQLTNHTDFALRALIALALVAPESITVGEIAAAYGISHHHLTKVVQKLAGHGYVETLRGKSGGVRLLRNASEIRLGQAVRDMEPELGLVGCLRAEEPSCAIEPACRLKHLLHQGTERFLADLDKHTLATLLRPREALAASLPLAGLVRKGAGPK